MKRVIVSGVIYAAYPAEVLLGAREISERDGCAIEVYDDCTRELLFTVDN